MLDIIQYFRNPSFWQSSWYQVCDKFQWYNSSLKNLSHVFLQKSVDRRWTWHLKACKICRYYVCHFPGRDRKRMQWTYNTMVSQIIWSTQQNENNSNNNNNKVNTTTQYHLKGKPCNFCKEAKELIEKKGSKIPEMEQHIQLGGRRATFSSSHPLPVLQWRHSSQQHSNSIWSESVTMKRQYRNQLILCSILFYLLTYTPILQMLVQ